MTGELSLLQCFRANKTNLLEWNKPERNCTWWSQTWRSLNWPEFPGPVSGKQKELLLWRICTWVCLLMGMCWCNELSIRSARCLTTQNCWARVWGDYSRVVRITAPESFPACLARPRYPSMPWRAPLSQHALATSPSRLHWGPYSIITWFISSYLQRSLIPSLSCTTSQNTVVKILYLRQVCI